MLFVSELREERHNCTWRRLSLAAALFEQVATGHIREIFP